MPYFFDSYAIIEMINQSQNFFKYADEQIIITLLNLIEVTQYSLTHHGEIKARKVCDALSKCVADVSNDNIIKAVKFRNDNKPKSFSYADSVGYIYAKSNNLTFLTGDDAFKTMPNVEFVK